MQEPGIRLSRQQRRALERERSKGGRQASRSGMAAAASGAALTLGVALVAGQPAQAAVFNVSNLGDSGAGSLRQAIEDANGAAGADTVTFQAGLTGTITLTTGQLEITDSVDIQGPGAAVISVNGNDASRVFYLYNGSANIAVTISGLTVTGGNDTIGAGIVNFDEDLVLDGVMITDNHASSDGGGLWADGFDMDLTIRDSTVSGNTADGDGGGMYIEDTGGPLLIQNTVISGNDAAGSGGGIYFYDPDDSTTIEGSTISGNTAGEVGGGIYLYDTDGGTHLISGTTISGNTAVAGGGIFLYGPDNPFAIENSTISGNQAVGLGLGNGYGGGVFLYSLYGELVIRHSTVVGNSATGTGGGLFTLTGPVIVENTIVADNTVGVEEPDLGTEVDGSFDLSFSLVENPSTANITDNGGNVFNQDPQLGPLANNGGPTQTHLPASTSPAVNAGDPAFVPPPATDQRGFDRVVGGRLDIGAVEVNPGTIQLTASAASVGEAAGTITITATRTGGTDGAVSVTFATSDGTAVAPGDYTTAGGTLNWASGDGTAKTFQVTIINDLLDEPDETFNATISNPQGATLGGIATQVVTIVDDDAPVVAAEIPTLGDVGKVLLAALFGMGGLLLMRRRKKDLVAPMLAVTLAAGAGAVQAANVGSVEKAGKDVDVRAATLAQIEERGSTVVIRLSDGTAYEISRDQLKVVDTRKGGQKALAPNQPVVLKVRRGKDGAVQKVKVELVRTAEQARTAAAKDGD